MESPLLKYLNLSQSQAVQHTEGPVLILAGAGSGKTRVLTFRVAYLLSQKLIPAENIIMVTFTNKAAGEMKKRLHKLLDENSSPNLPFTGTFHSFCAKLLRKEGQYLGISPNFIIYDTQDKKEAIKEAFASLNLDPKKYKIPVMGNIISEAKNELISENEYLNIARGSFQEIVSKVYILYQKILKENNALDFDDLIFQVVNLWNRFPQVAAKYQDRFQYVLVDEYQDTNHAQYKLTKLLAKKWRNICVVGDASQSIYAWRGADFRNILNFKNDYPQVKIFYLEQNYRSTQKILDGAFSVISKNRTHPILKLWTTKQKGENLFVYQALNEQDEAGFIINEILNCQRLGVKLSDMAILYRTNAQSRVLEEIFLHNGVAYILIGGVRFYERKEIKDLLAYLRLLINPQDNLSLKRIEKLGKKKSAVYSDFIEKFLSSANSADLPTLQILDIVLKTTAYLERFDIKNEEDFERLENIKELRSVAAEFPHLIEFLENVSLVEREYLPDHPKHDQDHDAVSLMTLHAAKGLEFKYVFIVGMEEGLFPHAKTLLEPLEIEEERRLCYVGITRAMEKLYLTYTEQRLYFGQRNSNEVSRFLLDLPREIITLLHASNYSV